MRRGGPLFDCAGNLVLSGGGTYRLKSYAVPYPALELTPNGRSVQLAAAHTHYGLVVDVLALPEEDPIARLECDSPRVYEMPRSHSSQSLGIY